MTVTAEFLMGQHWGPRAMGDDAVGSCSCGFVAPSLLSVPKCLT